MGDPAPSLRPGVLGLENTPSSSGRPLRYLPPPPLPPAQPCVHQSTIFTHRIPTARLGPSPRHRCQREGRPPRVTTPPAGLGEPGTLAYPDVLGNFYGRNTPEVEGTRKTR